MSAYIVEDETINKVVSFLSMDRDAKYELDRQGIDLSNSKAQAKFGRELFKMNVAAVGQRYEDTDPAEFRELNYWYRFELETNKIKVYKALRCFLYQCSEGDVPERELYKKMEEISNWLAMEIVTDLPEYQQAAWG